LDSVHENPDIPCAEAMDGVTGAHEQKYQPQKNAKRSTKLLHESVTAAASAGDSRSFWKTFERGTKRCSAHLKPRAKLRTFPQAPNQCSFGVPN
jgi:endonuclease I